MTTSTAQNYSTSAGGGGAFGTNVGQIAQPTSIYDQLQANVPNYSAMTKTATGNIAGQLSGQISPSTMNLLQNKAASMGVNSGMPGSGFSQNNLLESLGLTSEGVQQQGITNYNQLSQTAGSQQNDPNLVASIATQNAVDAAAPNPQAAQTYAQSLFDKYLAQSSNPAGATGILNDKKTNPYGLDYGVIRPGDTTISQMPVS
jgi:hypothetical protein